MNNSEKNPWITMENGTRRRVDLNTNNDYYWIVDVVGRYGVYLKFDLERNIKTDLTLKGIELLLKNSVKQLEIFMFLDNVDDWEIFQILSFDLFAIMDRYSIDDIKAEKLLSRLAKWKNLLANKRDTTFGVEEQMGLFTELYCLKNTISKNLGYSSAINSWVGVEKDKQDFILENAAIEIKSHRTTKGNIASISSASQLSTEKKNLYLISYGLTQNVKGKTIDDLLEEISTETTAEQREAIELKLFESGWIPNSVKTNKAGFIVDSETIYEVNSKFPKINSEALDSRIIDVKYRIDLSKCSEFKLTVNDIFEVQK